ncbi:inversin-like isoform X3 [Symsagittifera roscoffensis]|uniref:inversin-like isoform X3 n=1 Tax=Symsagittifera roscoffensis TaxID=84072 RepID=UPI00307BB46C
MDNLNVKSSRSSRRHSHHHTNHHTHSSSSNHHYHFSNNQPHSSRSSSSVTSHAHRSHNVSGFFGRSADRAQLGSPTASFAAPSLSRLTIPHVNPNARTNALHLACINGDKQLVIKLVNSSDGNLSSRSVDRNSGNSARNSTRSAKNVFNGQQLLDVDTADSLGRTPLMYCVLGNKVDCAEYLIKSTKANVNASDNLGRTALHWAANKEHHKMLKLLIQKGGADCRAKDRDGLTPFHMCMKNRNSKSTALMMKNLNANDLEEQDNYKRTALHLAAMYGSYDQVQMLLQRDANVGIPDGEGKTPLHWAINSKHQHSCSIVQSLVEHMPSVVNWQDHDGRTSLHLAVAEGSYNLVKTLIGTEGCKLSCLDNMFRTPLHWAAVMDNEATAPQIVTLLLNKGCDWTCSDSNGATPLHYAAHKNNSETMRAFLEFSELVDQADIEGRTAFMWAAGAGALETLDVMLDCGVDLSQSDKNGATALHAAATSGNADCVKLLLNVGCKMTADNMKLTPLARAAELGHVAIAQLLIKHGAKLKHQDREGRYPLHWACYGGSLRMCELLVVGQQQSVDVNCSDHLGRTPLQYAAQKGFNNCISLLVQHGADPNLQDAQGRTALHWSCSLGHLDAVRLLVKCDAFPNYMEFSEERYTPLDYALLNSHHEVAQFMIENAGALSINGIRDIAASKIQAVFKGARERRSFIERRTLLLKHDKIRKNKISSTNNQQQQQNTNSNQRSQSQIQPNVTEKIYSAPEDHAARELDLEGGADPVDKTSSVNEKDMVTDSDTESKNSTINRKSKEVESDNVLDERKLVEETNANAAQNDQLQLSTNKATLVSNSKEDINESTMSANEDIEAKPGQNTSKLSNSDSINAKNASDRSAKSEKEHKKISVTSNKSKSDNEEAKVQNQQDIASFFMKESPIQTDEEQQEKITTRSEKSNKTESAGGTARGSENFYPYSESERSAAQAETPRANSETSSIRINERAHMTQSTPKPPKDEGKDRRKKVRSPNRERAHPVPESSSSSTSSKCSSLSSRTIGEGVEGEGEGEGEEGRNSKMSIVSMYRQMRQESVVPFDVTAEDESKKRRSVDFQTPTSSLQPIQRHLSHANFSLSTLGDVRDRDDYEQCDSTHRSATDDHCSELDFAATADCDSEFSDYYSHNESQYSYNATNHNSTEQLARSSNTRQFGSRKRKLKCSKNSVTRSPVLTTNDALGATGSGDRAGGEGGGGGESMARLLERQEHFKRIRLAEQQRRSEIQRRNNAAKLIQRAWRTYGFKSKKFYKAFKEVFLLRRSIGQEQSLKQEVAALTIQLAWRRYYRRKVLMSNNPHRTMLNKNSRAVRNKKQNFLEARIYNRQERAKQFYGMRVQRQKRPYYMRHLAYQSALDYNFALDQYRPVIYPQYPGVAPRRIRSVKHFSYNLRA